MLSLSYNIAPKVLVIIAQFVQGTDVTVRCKCLLLVKT